MPPSLPFSPPKELFRKTALERIASPEQLDQLVSVADAKSWIALAGIGLCVGFLVIWGIFGSVPTNVPAKGILIPQGGRVLAAMSPAGGIVDKLFVSVGDSVKKGQVLARIRQDEARQKLTSAQQVVAEKQRDLMARQGALKRQLDVRLGNIGQRQQALGQSAEATAARIAYLERRLVNREEMLRQGFTTVEKFQDAQDELNRARRDLADNQAQMSAVKAEEMQARLQSEQEQTRLQDAVSDAKRAATELETQIDVASAVVSPGDGRVNEIKLTEGVVVATGQPVLGIESEGRHLQAVLFIPTEHGKKVRPGMIVRIAPSTIKKEEVGTLIGKVAEVSSFPATRQGIAAVVQNETLVDDFIKKGAPYEAHVDLQSADTPSGYAWSSGKGPAIDLTSGTTIDVTVAVKEQAPISLILPLLRRATGIDD